MIKNKRTSRPRTLFLLLFLAAALSIGACNDHRDKKEEAQTAVLHQLPFAPITDSLEHIQGSPAAALYFRRADLLARANHHELAAEDFRHSWQLDPQELTGFRYASTLSIIGRMDSAEQLLLDCEKRFPDNPSFTSMLGDLYQQAGKTKEAVGVYDALLHKDSTNNEAWYEKGLLLEKMQDTPGAVYALKKAYDLQPVNTYGLELAHLYAESRNAIALTICDDVLRKDSAHEMIDPLFIKGIYYSNTTQYKKAITQFDSCIGRDWKFTDAYLEKGIALFQQKRYDTAASTFLMTIKVSDTYPDGYFWVGRCYEATGHKDQAILYYRQALALDKDFTEAAEHIKRLQ